MKITLYRGYLYLGTVYYMDSMGTSNAYGLFGSTKHTPSSSPSSPKPLQRAEREKSILEKIRYDVWTRVEGVPIVSSRIVGTSTLMLITGFKNSDGRYIPIFVHRYHSAWPREFHRIEDENAKGNVVTIDLELIKRQSTKYQFTVSTLPEEARPVIKEVRPKYRPASIQRTIDPSDR